MIWPHSREQGIELTRSWIALHRVADSNGAVHVPYGIWTSAARLTVYVAFDKHPRIGCRAHYFFTDRLKAWAFEQKDSPPVYGSRAGLAIARSGCGYLFVPKRIFLDRTEALPPCREDDPDTAVQLVKTQLQARARMTAVRAATIDEQLCGIDLVACDRAERYGCGELPVEVKSREWQHCYDAFFLQLSETNQGGLIR